MLAPFIFYPKFFRGSDVMKNSERIKHYEDCIKAIELLLSYSVHGITKMKIRAFKYHIALLRKRLDKKGISHE